MKILRRIFILCLMLLPMHSASADLQCNLCTKKIEGRYVEYKGQGTLVRVCRQCNVSKPKCASCRVPHLSNQLQRVKGENLCSPCEARAKHCSMCESRIQGRYYQIRNDEGDGKLFCKRCYIFSKKCKVCQVPSHRNALDPRSGACAECLPNLPTCKSCNAKITGTYFEYQFADGQFCTSCKRTRPECHVCNVPVGRQHFRFPDGRKVCAECNVDAVSDPKEIRAVMDEVQLFLEESLNMTIERPYTLHIEHLSRHSFQAQRARDGDQAHSPLFGRELGLYRYANGKSEIFILYGLPKEMLYETAAHELAHAWQIENCPPDQSLNLKEGFAQWVAAYVLQRRGYDKAFTKLEARTDYPYGTGYRRVKALQQRHGMQEFFRVMKTIKR